ncbi:MAG: hypothetical protein VYE68_12570 [Acidobacteriota bacterium]|nr:hypothetical protein [Acidobacteriota bacterium]
MRRVVMLLGAAGGAALWLISDSTGGFSVEPVLFAQLSQPPEGSALLAQDAEPLVSAQPSEQVGDGSEVSDEASSVSVPPSEAPVLTESVEQPFFRSRY